MDENRSTWVFGYGSLIWGTGPVQTVERVWAFCQDGTENGLGFHKAGMATPTRSLRPGGQVNGMYCV